MAGIKELFHLVKGTIKVMEMLAEVIPAKNADTKKRIISDLAALYKFAEDLDKNSTNDNPDVDPRTLFWQRQRESRRFAVAFTSGEKTGSTEYVTGEDAIAKYLHLTVKSFKQRFSIGGRRIVRMVGDAYAEITEVGVEPVGPLPRPPGAPGRPPPRERGAY